MPHRRLLNALIDSQTYKRIIQRLDSIVLRKKKVSVYDILVNLFNNIKNDDIMHKASSVAFNFTLAVFPAIIFLFSLIPYIPIPNVYEGIMELIGDMSIFNQVSHTIEDVVSKPRGDLLSFGFFMSLYLSTNGMSELAQTFNKIYRTVERRGFIKTRLIATLLTVILAFALFTAISLLIIGELTIDFMLERGFLDKDLVWYSIIILRFGILFILLLFTVCSIYYFAPALHNRWKFISIGAVVATLLIMLVSYLLSFYITNFGTYNKIYGSIGAMIAFMFWFFLVSVIILIGFEVNASIDQAAAQKTVEE